VVSDSSSTDLPMFLEKMTQYAHLFDDFHRDMFIQLLENVKNLEKIESEDDWKTFSGKTSNYTSIHDRTTAEIGQGYIDNTRGELKALASPGYQKARNYVLELRTKILAMIDALVKHLRASRRKLSEDEMLANEHFADFQSQMIKENRYLKQKIVELNKNLIAYRVQLNLAQASYKKREELRQEAEATLKYYRKICREKRQYYTRETNRRTRERGVANNAVSLFTSIFTNFQKRTLLRVSTNYQGKKYSKSEMSDHNVVDYSSTAEGTLGGNIKSRVEVAYY